MLAGTGFVTVGLSTRRGSPSSPARRPFALMAGLAGLSGVTLGALACTGTEPARYYTTVASLWLLLAVPWTVFATAYTGWRRLTTPRTVGAVTALMTIEALSITFGAVLPTEGPLAAVITWLDLTAVLLSLTFGIIGIAIVVRTMYTSPLVDRRLGGGLLAAGAGPWLTLLVAIGAFAQYDLGGVIILVATGFSVSATAAVLAVRRASPFESTPAAANLGRSTVFGALNEPVLVVDERRRVVDLNAAAKTTFDVDLTAIAGEQVRDVVGRDPYTLSGDAELELHTADGPRQYTVSISSIADQHDRAAGHAVLFQDITTERTQRQRLAVLNRVLRHNLRNRMNVLEGYAEVLEEYVDDDRPEAYLDEILATAAGLSELGEKARTVEKVLSAPRESAEHVRLATVIETVAEEVQARYSDVTVVSHLEADPPLAVNPLLIEHALSQIVENAAEHTDSADPQIEIRVRVLEDEQRPLSISVADNGPGIPAHEREALQSGDEKPLEHGSGLGLWAANWVVTRLGGQIDFDSNEPAGTVVTIKLPPATAPGHAPTAASEHADSPTGEHADNHYSETSATATAQE
jgi:signal transduction histidine kinase